MRLSVSDVIQRFTCTYASCYMRVFVPIDNTINKRSKKQKDKGKGRVTCMLISCYPVEIMPLYLRAIFTSGNMEEGLASALVSKIRSNLRSPWEDRD